MDTHGPWQSLNEKHRWQLQLAIRALADVFITDQNVNCEMI